jgi:catechol 2,3-dioxygenase-like lactoylglutathione lyase family enzyme
MRQTLNRNFSIGFAALTFAAITLQGQPAIGQQATTVPTVVSGIYNWIRTTGDAQRNFVFYRDVFGLELARSTFAGPAREGAPPARILTVAEARSDSLVANLTDTEGARFRTVFMHAANTPFGIELSEFFDIPRNDRAANAWDPGASMLMFSVRDLGTIVSRLDAADAPVVTLGGAPLDTPAGRSILVRDPDGYLVLVTQASPADISAAVEPGEIVGTSIGISVADSGTALAFYRDLLGFEVGATRRATAVERRLHGIENGELTQTTIVIPRTDVTVLISAFELSDEANQQVPFQWRIQDVGAPQFQLQVSGLDALLQRTSAAGYRFLSVGGQPIQRAFGRFVFAIDGDGILVEYVEPAAARATE